MITDKDTHKMSFGDKMYEFGLVVEFCIMFILAILYRTFEIAMWIFFIGSALAISFLVLWSLI